MTPVTADVWRRLLAAPRQAGEFSSNIVDHARGAYAAVDRDNGRHLLVRAPEGSPALKDERSRGFRLVTRDLEVEAAPLARFFDVTCTERAAYEVFDHVCTAILQEFERGTAAADAVLTVVRTWRRFFGAPPSEGMTPEEMRGLFAELWFLARWLLPKSLDHVAAWCGPMGVRHDFQLTAAAVEVKSTVSTRGRVHRINGVEQLIAPDDRPLLLHSIRLRQEPAGLHSLVTILEEVHRLLEGRSDLRDAVDERLRRAKYLLEHTDRYAEVRFRVVDEALFRVDGRFPRITTMPDGVESISYEVNLETCPELVIARRPEEWTP